MCHRRLKDIKQTKYLDAQGIRATRHLSAAICSSLSSPFLYATICVEGQYNFYQNILPYTNLSVFVAMSSVLNHNTSGHLCFSVSTFTSDSCCRTMVTDMMMHIPIPWITHYSVCVSLLQRKKAKPWLPISHLVTWGFLTKRISEAWRACLVSLLWKTL